MGLLATIKKIKKAEPLLVTPHVIRFLEREPEGVVWDDAGYALFKEIVERSKGNEDRSGRFGASAAAKCKRAQVFTYLGMPGGKVIDPEKQNLFNDGKWRHLRWQMMGVQSGALTHAEWPVVYKPLRLKTSVDGLNTYENFGFELKGDRNMSRVMHETPYDHDLQMHTMMLAMGWDTFAYVVEDKSSQEWKEIITHRDEKKIKIVRENLEELNEHVDNHQLPLVLPACAAKEGPYRTCDFAAQCLRREREQGDYWPSTPGDWDS